MKDKLTITEALRECNELIESEKKYSINNLIDIIKDHSLCLVLNEPEDIFENCEETYVGYSTYYKNYVLINLGPNSHSITTIELNDPDLIKILYDAQKVNIYKNVVMDWAIAEIEDVEDFENKASENEYAENEDSIEYYN